MQRAIMDKGKGFPHEAGSKAFPNYVPFRVTKKIEHHKIHSLYILYMKHANI
jgi:hypothetical protein